MVARSEQPGPAAQHPGLGGQVGQAQGPPPGQGMAGGEHGQHRIVEEVVEVDRGRVGQRLGQQGQVGPAGPQALDRLGGRLDQGQLDPDPGMGGPEGGDGLGQQGGGRAGEGRDPHLAAVQPGDQLEITLGPLELGQDGVGPAGPGPGRRR
jgi:hypothetical protein